MHPAYRQGHAAGLTETIARKLVAESDESRVTLAMQVFEPDIADARLVIASENPGIKHIGRRVTFGENITPAAAANYMIALTPNEETPFLFNQISAGTGEYAVNGPWYAFGRQIAATDTYDNTNFTNVRVKGSKLTIDNTAAFQAGGNIAGLISGGVIANPPSPAQYSFSNLTSLDSNSSHSFLQRPIFTASSTIRLPSMGPLRNTIKRRDMGEVQDVYDWDFSASRHVTAAAASLTVFSTIDPVSNLPSTWLWPGTWGNPQLDLSGALTLAANYTASPPLCTIALVYSDASIAGVGANFVLIPIPLVSQFGASSVFSMSAHVQLRDYLPAGFELAPILGFSIRLANDGAVPLTALRTNGGSTIRLNNGRYRERDLILGYMALSNVPQSFVVRSTSTVDLVMDRTAEKSFGDVLQQDEVVGDADLLVGMINRVIANGGLPLAYRGDPDKGAREFVSILGAATQHGHAWSLGDLWKGVKRAAAIVAPVARPLLTWAGNEAIKTFVPPQFQDYATKGLQTLSGMAAGADSQGAQYDMAGHAGSVRTHCPGGEEKDTAPASPQAAAGKYELLSRRTPTGVTVESHVFMGTPPPEQSPEAMDVEGLPGVEIRLRQPNSHDDRAGHAATFNDGKVMPESLTFRLMYSLILGTEVKVSDEERAKLDGAFLDVWFGGQLVRQIMLDGNKVVPLAAGRAAGAAGSDDRAGHASGKRDRVVVRPGNRKRFRTPERPGGAGPKPRPNAPRKPRVQHAQTLSERLSDIEGRLSALEYTMLAPSAPFSETVEAEPEFHDSHPPPHGPSSGLEGKAAGREQESKLDLGRADQKRQRVSLLGAPDDMVVEGAVEAKADEGAEHQPIAPPDGPVLQAIREADAPVLDRTLGGALSDVVGDFYAFQPNDCPVPIDCASLCVNAGSEAVAALKSNGAIMERIKSVIPARVVKWFVSHKPGCLKDYTECDCCLVPKREGELPKREGHASAQYDPSRFTFAAFGAEPERKAANIPRVSEPEWGRAPFPGLLEVLRDRALLQASSQEVTDESLSALVLQPWLDRANLEAVARGGVVNASPIVPGLGRAAYCGAAFPAPARADVLGFGTVIVSPFKFAKRINLGAVQTIAESEFQTHEMPSFGSAPQARVVFRVDAGSDESKVWWATKFFPWVDKNRAALQECALVKRFAVGRLGSWAGMAYPTLYVHIIRNNLTSVDGTSSFGAIWSALSGLPVMGLLSSDMDSGTSKSLELLPVVMLREKVMIASRLRTNLIVCAASSDAPNAPPIPQPFSATLDKARAAKPDLYMITDMFSLIATLDVLASTLSDQGAPDFVRTLVTNVDEAAVEVEERSKAMETKGYMAVKKKLDSGRITSEVFEKKVSNMMRAERTPIVAATREWSTVANELSLVQKLTTAIANLQTLPDSSARKNLAARGANIIEALKDPKTPMKSKVERVTSFIQSVNNTVESAASAGTGKKKGGAEAALKAATAALASLRGDGPGARPPPPPDQEEERERKRGRQEAPQPPDEGGFAESQE